MSHSDVLNTRPLSEKLQRFLLSKASFRTKIFLFAFYILISIYALSRMEYFNVYGNTADAINSGHPFHLMDYGSGYLEYVPYYDYLGEHGFDLMLSALSKLFSLIPFLADYQFTGYEAPIISFCILALFNACLLSFSFPNVLLIFSQIGYMALVFLTDKGTFTGCSNYRGADWLASLMACFLIVSLILDWNAQETKRKYPYIILGVFTGFFTLFRLTIPFIFQLSLLMIFLGSLVFITKNWKKSLPWFALRKMGWAYLGYFGFNCLFSFSCTLIYDLPFSFSHPLKHGGGQSLYPSLGYVANPYNISWEDENAYVNHMLVYDSMEPPTHAWAKNMSQLFWEIVQKDPYLFVKNIFAKVKKLNEYLLVSEITIYNDMDICSVTPNKIHRLAYLISLAYIFSLCVVICFRKTQKLQFLFLLLSSLGLLMTCATPAILIFPGYYASFLGFLFCAACVLVPLFFILLKEGKELPCEVEEKVIAKRIGVSAVAVLAIAGSFIILQSQKNENEAQNLLSDANPRQRIENMGYRYGYLFNRLGKEDQEKILAKLDIKTSSSEMFAPKFLCVQKREGREHYEAHLIVYLSGAWTPPIPRADQGPSASYIHLAKGSENFTNSSFSYEPQFSVFNRITDGSWNGKYTFITLPIAEEFIENTEKITVSAWEMRRGESLVYKEIGSTAFPISAVKF